MEVQTALLSTSRSFMVFVQAGLDIGPGKMVSLNMVKGGSATMQVPSCIQVMKVNWAKQTGVFYRPLMVICGKVECEIPVLPD